MFRRIMATTLGFLLTGISLPAQAPALGAVTQSAGGHLNNSTASVGTTIYDGDSLSTETAGSITLSAGPTQLTLAGDSSVLVNHDGAGLTATLQRGSLAFRVENGGALKVNAVDVHIRPQTTALTAGQVTLENCAVLVTSRVQSLEVTAGKETKIVEEGKSYRVSLEGACKNGPPSPISQGRFLAIPIAAAIGIIIGVKKGMESPDRP
jgi:ferric-dicitrate binding protein FerR (iron transport regulator)